MTLLRLRGQGLSVLISALYLSNVRPAMELELASEDVLDAQMLLQKTEALSSQMWKAIQPLLTQEWGAYRVSYDGLTRKSVGRVALLDSTQALIELEQQKSVRVSEAASWSDRQSPVWLPNLEDPRLEAKIVRAESLRDLAEPVVIDVAGDAPGTYSQYIPIGGSHTLFTKHRVAWVADNRTIGEFADEMLARLQYLEASLNLVL